MAQALLAVRPGRSRHPLARRCFVASRFVDPTTHYPPHYLNQTPHFVQIAHRLGFAILPPAALGSDPPVGRATIE